MGSTTQHILLLFLLTTCSILHNLNALSSQPQFTRRDALIGAASLVTTSTLTTAPSPAQADGNVESIDMAAIQAARARSSSSSSSPLSNPFSTPSSSSSSSSALLAPKADPPPLIPITINSSTNKKLKMPRIGYSFYKTPSDQAARCTSLALRAGIRYFDVGTQYNSNTEIAKTLQKYLSIGLEEGMNSDFIKNEKAEMLEFLDQTNAAYQRHALETLGSSSSLQTSTSLLAPTPRGSIGRKGRREGLFISHKLSNDEQSADPVSVRRAVKQQIQALGCTYLDMVSIHSPLTTKEKRLSSYRALLDLRDAGFVKSLGVCNYGLGALKEIEEEGLDLPSVNQLELSPFNPHADIVEYCQKRGIVMGCAAWSKLSSESGPQDQWAALGELAKQKKMTKAQVLVRWALQKGYVCVPRSGCKSKLERMAIAENSYGGVNMEENGGFVLSKEEMNVLDGLDVGLKAGKLGRRDGWEDGDVMGVDWDPTDFV